MTRKGSFQRSTLLHIRQSYTQKRLKCFRGTDQKLHHGARRGATGMTSLPEMYEYFWRGMDKNAIQVLTKPDLLSYNHVPLHAIRRCSKQCQGPLGRCCTQYTSVEADEVCVKARIVYASVNSRLGHATAQWRVCIFRPYVLLPQVRSGASVCA